jgi:DNA-binding NarL/FixJ family response regulator
MADGRFPERPATMLKVLILDAYQPFRQALKQTLRDGLAAVEVEEAANGSEALQKAAVLHPQVVCMDVHLPDAKGLDIACRITAAHPGVTVVILTASDGPEYRSAALAAGITHFLSKNTTSGADIVQLLASIRQRTIPDR